ncbi:MAG: AbrB/MazE/SpoVT family DNA-binding domain-containing protein [Kiritimatiellaeota bacterium]|nr:AbrB/MazE/SpoVT family DNA-binding domain-containing protein [Kiritimatiellota bacterium]
MTKTLSIDKAGRVVIPQAIRQMFGWNAGAVLEIKTTREAVVLTPMEDRPALVYDDGLLAHTGKMANGGKTTQEMVSKIIAEDRDARAAAVWGVPM